MKIETHTPSVSYSTKQIPSRLKQLYFQSGKFELAQDNDCFIKSPTDSNKKSNTYDASAISFGNNALWSIARTKSLYLLDEIARLEALRNIDIPIVSIDEYRKVLERMKNAKNLEGIPYIHFDYNIDFVYKNISEDELGLIPYCGEWDKSKHINEFLSGRFRDLYKFKQMPEQRMPFSLWALKPESYSVIEDMIRALDYSFKKLDEKFGKYEGIVFRQGVIDSNSGQYISTSMNPRIAAKLRLRHEYVLDYQVVRTYSGHRTFDLQREKGSKFADSEQEITLDRRSIHRLLSLDECDDELLQARETLADCLFEERVGCSHLPTEYTREQFLDLIKVHEEVRP